MEAIEVNQAKILLVLTELLAVTKASGPAAASAKAGRGTKRARARDDEGEGRGETVAGFLEEVAAEAMAMQGLRVELQLNMSR